MASRRHPGNGAAEHVTDGDGQTSDAGDAFRVALVHEAGCVRVCPVGDVDLASIDALRERMDVARAVVTDRLILDLRATSFLDSSGLHLVLETEVWAALSGIEFAIIAGRRGAQRAFDAIGLSAWLPFVDGAEPHSSATSLGAADARPT